MRSARRPGRQGAPAPGAWGKDAGAVRRTDGGEVALGLRERLLERLEEAGPRAVSGEELGEALGVSRAAVWKHVAALRRDGYEIEASPRRGYRLVGRPDRMFPWEIRRRLPAGSLGRFVVYETEVDSTNDVAAEHAAAGAPEGLLVVAEAQRKGKGRRGRSWASPFGKGVWSSLLLRPSIAPAQATWMGLLAGVAVAAALRRDWGLPAGVKWPNDVEVAGRKIAGILVEMEAEMEAVSYIIVGAGINANLERGDFPEEARETATSLRLELGRPVDRVRLLCGCLEAFTARYRAAQRKGFEAVRPELEELSTTLGQDVRIIDGERSWEGRARRIAEDGALIVWDGRKERPVHSGDVSVRPAGHQDP